MVKRVVRWQPIESVPAGMMVLVCSMKATEARNAFYVDWFVDGKPCAHLDRIATHWMSLPAAPEESR